MSGRRIREDHAQYRDQVKDKVKSRLKDYIKTGKKVERRGDDYIVVDKEDVLHKIKSKFSFFCYSFRCYFINVVDFFLIFFKIFNFY